MNWYPGVNWSTTTKGFNNDITQTECQDKHCLNIFCHLVCAILLFTPLRCKSLKTVYLYSMTVYLCDHPCTPKKGEGFSPQVAKLAEGFSPLEKLEGFSPTGFSPLSFSSEGFSPRSI